jgi:hypothetical protein
VFGALHLIKRLLDELSVALPPVGGLIPFDRDCAGCEAEVRPTTQLVALAMPVVLRSDMTTSNMIARVRCLAIIAAPFDKHADECTKSRQAEKLCKNLVVGNAIRCVALLRTSDQLVQLSVAGLVVAVPVSKLALTPVSEGIEKKVLTHAAGEEDVMLESFVSVTVSGLFGDPDAATVRGAVKVCELPLVAVAKFQSTSLGVTARQPVWVALRALVV